jgi:ElaB/YqjD/DUF883 family membrane-anchored ribosome-binding protein
VISCKRRAQAPGARIDRAPAGGKGERLMSRVNNPSDQNAGSGTQQLKESAQQVKENLRDMGSQVRDVASQQYDNLRQQASDYYEQGRQRAQEWEQGLEQYVQEKPIQSLLIAAGVGLLIGMLWKRS